MLFRTFIDKLLAQLAHAPLASAMCLVGLAVIAAQLYAMATLAHGQVHKAQVRDSLQVTANSMLANCLYRNKGAALNACRPLSAPSLMADAAVSD